MSNFQLFIFRWLLSKWINQDVKSAANLADMYKMIRYRAEQVFYEDNKFTINSFLREHFNKSIKE